MSIVKGLANRDKEAIIDVEEGDQFEGLEMNLAHLPKDTYHYDDLTPLEADELLDQIKMFNELKKNIRYKDFL